MAWHSPRTLMLRLENVEYKVEAERLAKEREENRMRQIFREELAKFYGSHKPN